MTLVLASQSKARIAMLKNAGIDFETIPVGLDEEEIIKKADNQNPEDISLLLAKEKALHVSNKYPEHYIIGSDQVLSMKNKIYSKAKNKDEALERLMQFQGQEHQLNASVVVAQAGEILWSQTDTATLKMRALSSRDIENYAEIAGDDLTSCVGCYAIEGAGIRLFEKIQGDNFTIRGMPLLPLMNYMIQEGIIA